MNKYPTIEQALHGGPASVGNEVNRAVLQMDPKEISDLLDGGLSRWLTSVGIPRDYHFAFKVKRLRASLNERESNTFFLKTLKETYELQHGDWISLIRIKPPEKFNSCHLQKYLMFAIYDELRDDLKDHHAAFKTTLLHLDDVRKHTDLFNRVLNNLPDATIIDEVIMDAYVIRKAARSIITDGTAQLTWDRIEYREGIRLS